VTLPEKYATIRLGNRVVTKRLVADQHVKKTATASALLPAANSSPVSAEFTGEVAVGKDPLKISPLETLGTTLQTERPRVRFPIVPNYSHVFDSASNINKYQEYFLVGREGRV
jgi:hypothetical protein